MKLLSADMPRRRRLRLMLSHCLGEPLLGVLTLSPFRYIPLYLPPDIRDAFGGVGGLTSDEQFVFAAIGSESCSALLVLDRHTLQMRDCHPMEDVWQVHSITVKGKHLFVVSTATNEVIRFTLENGRPTERVLVWQPDCHPERFDRHHLNSILLFEQGGFLISGLDGRGRSPREPDWPIRVEGFIQSVPAGTTIRPLWHPHSLLEVDGTLAFCESGAGTLHVLQRQSLVLSS